MAFIAVAGLLAAFFIPVLQANGVDVNWWISLLIYVGIIVGCMWSFVLHVVPHRNWQARVGGSAVLVLLIGFLASP
jgi:hypothetical protein